jgi:hypothetical protein
VVATRLMGFDPFRLKIYSRALAHNECNFGVRALVSCPVINLHNYCLHNRHRFPNKEGWRWGLGGRRWGWC